MNRCYPGQRPLIDLDLGHAHQFGYRAPQFIPTAGRPQWPTRPARTATTTRTTERETRR